MSLVWLLSLAVPASMLAQDPIPSEAEVKRAEAILKKTFAKDFAAKDRVSRRDTGRRFLEQAAGASDPVDRYVLFRGAVDFAASALDPGTALKAMDRIVQLYDVGKLANYGDAVGLAKRNVVTADDASVAADFALSCWERAFAVDDFDQAAAWAKDAGELAKKANDPNLKVAADEMAKDALEAKKLFDRSKEPVANPLERGTYLLGVKGDWATGLALLTEGADPALQGVAKKDLAQPADPKAKFELGEAWIAVAKKEKNPLLRRTWELRGRQQQEDAIRGAQGLARTQMAKTLIGPLTIVKATYGPGGKGVDVTRLVTVAIESDPWMAFRADDSLAGIPNGAPMESLVIEYMISGRKGTETALEEAGGMVVVPGVPERGVIVPGASRSFRIVSAHHGIGTKCVDATVAVRAAATDPYGEFSTRMTRIDPYPGTPKSACVQFEWHGRRFLRYFRDGQTVPVMNWK